MKLYESRNNIQNIKWFLQVHKEKDNIPAPKIDKLSKGSTNYS